MQAYNKFGVRQPDLHFVFSDRNADPKRWPRAGGQPQDCSIFYSTITFHRKTKIYLCIRFHASQIWIVFTLLTLVKLNDFKGT